MNIDTLNFHNPNASAWDNSSSDQITYKTVIREIMNLPSEWKSALNEKKCIMLNSSAPFDCAISFMRAWQHGVSICIIPSDWPHQWKKNICEVLGSHKGFFAAGKMKASDIFYVIPTSGSSGAPKLVAITRENWSQFFESIWQIYNSDFTGKVALTYHPTFDPFFALLTLTWLSGGTLVPLQESQIFSIFDFIRANQIEIWSSVPSLLALNLQKDEVRKISTVKGTLFTGEQLNPSLAHAWSKLAPESYIDNLYGPIETTVWVSRHRLIESDFHSTIVPIGLPFRNCSFSASDNNELCIDSRQIGAGYLHLNSVINMPIPYLTGDIAEYRDDNWHLLGRRDDQVKHFGKRLELELIEIFFRKEFNIQSKALLTQSLTQLPEENRITLNNLVVAISKRVDYSRALFLIKEQLPSIYSPKKFYIVDPWPLTISNKTDVKKIRFLIESKSIQPEVIA